MSEYGVRGLLIAVSVCACAVNLIMTLPNQQSFYRDYAHLYQLALCVPLAASVGLNVAYMLLRRNALQRKEPVHVSPVQVTLSSVPYFPCNT